MGWTRPFICVVKITIKTCYILTQMFFVFIGTETAQHAREEDNPSSVLGGGGDDGPAGADSDKENVPVGTDGRVEYLSDEGDGSGGNNVNVLAKVRLESTF